MKYKGSLQAEERKQISLILSNNSTMMQIAAALNRAASTIGTEVYHIHSPGGYRAVSAHSPAKKRERDSHRRPSMILSNEQPWQRGTNENTNGLVRGFFPKGTDLNLVTKLKLSWVQNTLNERPRQTLEFNKLKETFNSLLLEY